MKLIAIRTVAAAALIATLAAPAVAQNLAVVNGKALPMSRLTAIEAQFERTGRPVTPEMREQLKQRIIQQEALAQAAEKAGMASTPEYKSGMEEARQAVLINSLREDFLKKTSVPDAAAKAEYDKAVKAAAASGDEYRAHHILVEKESEAKDLIAKIKGGAKLEDLAKTASKDPGSGAKGGDLGWASASAYVGEFGDALKKLKKGEMTQTPVKTQFGYHIIRMDDKRASQAKNTKLPPYAEVKDKIIEQLKQQKLNEYMTKLISSAKVE